MQLRCKSQFSSYMTPITIPAGHACANQGAHRAIGWSALRYILKNVRKSLCTEAWQALAGRSGKDGVASFTHSERIQKLLLQIEVFQRRCQVQKLPHATGNEVPVDLAGLVAKANNSVFPGSVPLNFGKGFNRDHDEMVVNAWSDPLQELCLHSCLSGCDVVLLHCAVRRCHKTTCGWQVAELPGTVSIRQAHASHRVMKRNQPYTQGCSCLGASKNEVRSRLDAVLCGVAHLPLSAPSASCNSPAQRT